MKIRRYLTLILLSALGALTFAQVKVRFGPDDVLPIANIPVFDPDQHIATSIDRRIAGLTANTSTKAIYSTLTTTTATRSNTCWVKDIDISALAFWQSRHGFQIPVTAITADYAIGANHAVLLVGDSIKWLGSDNVVYTRTISTVTNIATTDIALYRLNSPLPGAVKPVKFLPADYATKLSVAGLPMFSIDQDRNALVREVASMGPTSVAMQTPADSQRLAFNEGWIVGDSGSGAFFIVDRELVIVSTAHGGGAGDGPNPAEFVDEINAVVTTPVSVITLPARQKISTSSLSPTLANTAFITSSQAPTAGQIPLVRGDTNKLDVSVIPATTAAAVEWTDVQNRPFTLASTGGNAAADSGKAVLFDESGRITAENLQVRNDPFIDGFIGVVAGNYARFASFGPGLPALFGYQDGAGGGFSLALQAQSNSASATDIVGQIGRGDGGLNIYGYGALDWVGPTAATAKTTTRANLGMISTTTTWNPASLANGATEKKSSISLPGAAAGDVIVAQLSTILSSDWAVQGAVTAANTVEVKITNNTGGTVDLANGTLRVIALKF